MAQVYIGANRGADGSPDALTVGSSTGSTDVEVRIDDSKSLTRLDVELILDAIVRYLENKGESQIGSV